MKAISSAVTVRVPGSTSNCGAGFDTLGLALQIYNEVTVEAVEGLSPVPISETDRRGLEMVKKSADLFFKRSGVGAFGFRFSVTGEVPPARGLGSSVTVIAGVLAGLNAIVGSPLVRHDLVALATAQEGHPDNASAGVLGGFCVARCDPRSGAYVDVVRIEVPESLVFVTASPSVEMLTKESRGVLPSSLPYFDAVKSINSASYFVAALATGSLEKLRGSVCDFMHEPYRLPRIPGGREAIDAGVAAGGYTGWLSGSGSTVLCVSPAGRAAAVGAAMKSAFAQAGLSSEIRALAADNVGLRIVS